MPVMTTEEIIEKLRGEMKAASEEDVDWDGVTADTDIETLGFDSLSVLDLIYDVQQAFGMTFDAEKLTAIRTVGELANFLREQMDAA